MPRIAAAERHAHGETRRAQILDAALRLWMRQGFHATPVDAVAREAGVAKGTIYLYFPTKEAMLAALVDRHSLLPAIEELTQRLGDVPPERAIPLIASELWQRLKERAPLIALLMREVSFRPEHARIFLERVVLPANRRFAAYLDRFVERGVLRPCDTFAAGRVFLGMLVMFVLSQEVLGGAALRPIDDETVVETAAQVFLRGVLAAREAS
ncbi:MAG TPA: TetR/AcrR family transcriptional regulator [Myxococcota bacterium]|nr:TetR/AcrR family transcriptional regulator [Myxococcota bacterium]